MGKNSATTCSKSNLLVRSYQISQLFFDLCQLTNTKLKFFEAILFKYKTGLSRRLSIENNISMAKNEAANCFKSGK